MKRLPVLVGLFAATGLTYPMSTVANEINVTLSGQVTPAIVFGSNVEDPEIVDNTGTGSRFRIRSKQNTRGVQVFTRYEIQIQENQSFGPVDGSESIDTRYAEVGIKGSFGSISLGKGDGASNATAEASYQVSGNILGGGHLPFFAVRGALNKSNPDAQVGYTYYDGFSRNSRLRYDTPSWQGLNASASLATGNRTEAAIRLKRELGPGKLTLLAGVADSGDGSDDRTMLSGGYRFTNGFSFAASFSSRTQADGPDLDSNLLSLNYQISNLILSVDVGAQGVDGENEVQQIGAEYKFSKALDIYGGYTNFDNANNTSVDAFYSGMRFKF